MNYLHGFLLVYSIIAALDFLMSYVPQSKTNTHSLILWIGGVFISTYLAGEYIFK